MATTGAINVVNAADVVGLTIAPTIATATAINLADTDIATALSVGANDIVGTTGLINYSNFDVLATGAIQVAAGVGLDTNAAGTLALGATNSNLVTIAPATTITGLLTANGGVTADGGVFTVADATGAIHTGSTLDVDSTTTLGGNVTFDAGGTRTISVATAADNSAINLVISGPASSTGGVAGGNLVLSGGAPGAAGVRGAVLPSANSTDNFGATGTRWSSIFADTVDFLTSLTGATGTPTVNFSTVSAANLSLQADSVVDADVVNALTISGGTVNNTTIGATTASSGLFTSLGGADNQTALNLNIGVTGADAGAHTIALQIDGNTGLSVAATGDGAGSVGVRTIQVGVSAAADVVTVGDADADVSLTDAQWSIAATGAVTSSPGTDVASLTISPTVAQAIGINAVDTDIATALSVGANDIVGTTGLINYNNFDVAATGNITVQPAYGLDTNAAGALLLGAANATSIELCNSAACDTILIGTAGPDADTITIGEINDDVSITDAQWSVTGAGAASFVSVNIGTGTTITKHLSAAAANVVSASIAAASCGAYGAVTVTGAAAGDTVTVSPTAVASGIETLNLTWTGYVSAASTVTIRACNPTAGAIDALDTQTWRADVWQH